MENAMKEFTVSDGEKISYLQTGSGPDLVMVHGYGCSSLFFKRNIQVLSRDFRVTALDLRSHGESEKTVKGPRISRLATDVYELMETLNITDATYLGWSMGCSIGWSYWDLFVADRLRKFIFVDEPALLVETPENPTRLMDYAKTVEFANELTTGKDRALTDFISSILINQNEDISDLVKSSLKLDSRFASKLWYNHSVMDWSDVLPTITIPTLVISGRQSFLNPDTVKAMADAIPGAQFESFSTGHLMFFEESDRFNKIVANFIGSSRTRV